MSEQVEEGPIVERVLVALGAMEERLEYLGAQLTLVGHELQTKIRTTRIFRIAAVVAIAISLFVAFNSWRISREAHDQTVQIAKVQAAIIKAQAQIEQQRQESAQQLCRGAETIVNAFIDSVDISNKTPEQVMTGNAQIDGIERKLESDLSNFKCDVHLDRLH